MDEQRIDSLLQRLNRPALILVYDAIKRRAIDKRCRMSVRELSEDTSLPHATVQRAIRKLLTDGIIEVEQGRYPTEPSTFILKEVDTTDRLLEARAILNNVSQELVMLDTLLSGLSHYPDMVRHDAERFRKLTSAITSIAKITPEYVQVMLNINNLDDDLKNLLKL